MSGDALAAAMKVMDDYIDGLNRHDEAAVNNACNFPHVRLAGGKGSGNAAALNGSKLLELKFFLK